MAGPKIHACSQAAWVRIPAPPLIYSLVVGGVSQHADFYFFICKLEIIMVLK